MRRSRPAQFAAAESEGEVEEVEMVCCWRWSRDAASVAVLVPAALGWIGPSVPRALESRAEHVIYCLFISSGTQAPPPFMSPQPLRTDVRASVSDYLSFFFLSALLMRFYTLILLFSTDSMLTLS